MTLLGVAVLLVAQLPFLELHLESRIFVEELAFALILAGLFSLTVEKYHREEFRKIVITERNQLKQDVFLYAYGQSLNQQTRQEIRDLLEYPYYRKDLRLNWQLSPVPSMTDKVRVVRRFTYIQKNATMQPKPYQYRLYHNTAASAIEQKTADEVQSVRIRRKGKEISFPGQNGEMETEIEVIQPGEELESELLRLV